MMESSCSRNAGAAGRRIAKACEQEQPESSRIPAQGRIASSQFLFAFDRTTNRCAAAAGA
jgi:hypothetical protein